MSIKLKSFLDVSDKYSYYFYLTHMIYVKGILSLMNLTNYVILDYFVVLLITIITSYILFNLTDKVSGYLNKIFYRKVNEKV